MCLRRWRDSIKTCRPWRVRRTCFVISFVITIASHISGLPLKFSFGFSLGHLGFLIVHVVFIVSYIPGLALKFSLPGSSRRIFIHGFCIDLLSATPIVFSCGVIPDVIRTCANGVAEGFALQVFAEMPTRRGRVGIASFI